jgi:hypothetical protein
LILINKKGTVMQLKHLSVALGVLATSGNMLYGTVAPEDVPSGILATSGSMLCWTVAPKGPEASARSAGGGGATHSSIAAHTPDLPAGFFQGYRAAKGSMVERIEEALAQPNVEAALTEAREVFEQSFQGKQAVVTARRLAFAAYFSEWIQKAAQSYDQQFPVLCNAHLGGAFPLEVLRENVFEALQHPAFVKPALSVRAVREHRDLYGPAISGLLLEASYSGKAPQEVWSSAMFAGMEHITESLVDALVQHQKERGVVSVCESDLEGEVGTFQPKDDFQKAVWGIHQHIYPIFKMLEEDMAHAVSALQKRA